MSYEIKNRVAESSLVTIDFDEFINQKKIIQKLLPMEC